MRQSVLTNLSQTKRGCKCKISQCHIDGTITLFLLHHPLLAFAAYAGTGGNLIWLTATIT